jgi:hypothetical protein
MTTVMAVVGVPIFLCDMTVTPQGTKARRTENNAGGTEDKAGGTEIKMGVPDDMVTHKASDCTRPTSESREE